MCCLAKCPKWDADRLPVVVRFPAGPQVSLKCGDQSKDNGAGHKKGGGAGQAEEDRAEKAAPITLE